MTEKLTVLRQTYLALTVVCIAAIGVVLFPRSNFSKERTALSHLMSYIDELDNTGLHTAIPYWINKSLQEIDPDDTNSKNSAFVWFSVDLTTELQDLAIRQLHKTVIHLYYCDSSYLGNSSSRIRKLYNDSLNFFITKEKSDIDKLEANFEDHSNFFFLRFTSELSNSKFKEHVWHMTPSEAYDYIVSKETDSLDDSVTIGGVSINHVHIWYIVPIFIFALTLYFNLHLKNFIIDKGPLTKIAFVPFYLDSLSKRVTFFLLHLLPTITITLVLFSYFSRNSILVNSHLFEFIIGILSIVGQFIVTRKIWLKIREIRSEIKKSMSAANAGASL